MLNMSFLSSGLLFLSSSFDFVLKLLTLRNHRCRFVGLSLKSIPMKLFAALLVILSFPVQSIFGAADGSMRFSRFGIEDGLSQNTVMSIVQDGRGFMWFATTDGLSRYDGYDFTVFRHHDGDSTSVSGNIIRKLFLDSSGRLWAGTSAGLSLYDSALERFVNFGTDVPLQVTSICEVSPDRLMVGTEGRLMFFDTVSGKFENGFADAMSEITATAMTRSGDTVWLGSETDGLFQYSISRDEFRRVGIFTSRRPVQCILVQPSGPVWVGTEGDGLFQIDKEGEEPMRNFRTHDGLGSNYVRSLALDAEGRLWIGTFNCLDIYDPVSESFASFRNDAFDDESLSQNSVRSIFRDSQGGMWLGTYYGGVNYWHPLRERFAKIQRKPYGNSLNDNIISCMVEDAGGIMWIGTNGGGLNRFDTGTGKFTWYNLSGRAEYDYGGSNDIKAIFIDGDKVYVGAHAGGMHILDKRTGTVSPCRPRSGADPPADVYAILEKNEREMWIGSLQGLFSYDRRLGTYTEILEDADGTPVRKLRIRTLMKDSGGRLWVGAEDGLQLFDVASSSYGQPCLSLCGPDVTGDLAGVTGVLCLMQSSSGMVWLGTRRGLFGYSSEDSTLLHYGVADGLRSDIIHGLEEDSFGRLWISTDNGLVCFNPYSGEFRSYTSSDGLPSSQFTSGSHCRRLSGEMYFGTVAGIAVFTPERLTDNPYSPVPVISGLKIFNRKVVPGDDTGILDRSLAETGRIRLSHLQNTFSISFTVPDYIAGRNSTFAYMLEGIDSDWQLTTTSRTASYARVPHGKYRFLVKAANNDGKWSAGPSVLYIKVLPVWYDTIFAKLMFFLVAAALIMAGFHIYVERKSMEARLEMDRKDREHQEELHQMKTRFFINISHELRTPLTLIITPLQEMISRASDIWMRKRLKYVYRNSQRLLHLVNQLMDYRRAELGVFKLKVRKEDVSRIVRENWSWYESLAQSRGIEYTLDSDIGEEPVYADGQYLELILNNLISNAFKYTDKGSISVSAKISRQELVIEVRDTGCGIAASKQDKIFERFYQLESKHIGSGIGLSLVQRLVELHHGRLELESEEGKGSVFRVIIPQSPDAYSDDEFDREGTEKDVHTTNSKDMFILDTENSEPGDVMAVEDNGKDWNVLIVDDDADMRSYMQTGLSSMFNVFTAPDGQAALDVINGNRVDLVVTDMVMPVLDGIRLCARIKHNKDTMHIPVIMLSVKSEVKDELAALKTGADDYIPKPFSMTALAAKIRNMLIARTVTPSKEDSRSAGDTGAGNVAFNAADDDFVRHASDIVMRHLDQTGFGTEAFAREIGLSRSGLHYKLKSITGESALDFIRGIRFREACRLLLEGRLTVSQVADRTGFGSASYFSSCFKKHFGCLPSEYAKLHKN